MTLPRLTIPSFRRISRNYAPARVISAAFLAMVISPGSTLGETLFESGSTEQIRIVRDKESGRIVTEQEKVNYHSLLLYGSSEGNERSRPEDQRVVARETVATVQDEGLEGTRSRLQVDLFVGEASGKYPRTPTHTLKIPDAHEARFQPDHWSAYTFGCCDAETYGRLYAYGASKPFLRFNERYWKISVPNDARKTRYVGLTLREHVPNDAAREALFAQHPTSVACITYTSSGKPLSQVHLRPKSGVSWTNRGLHTEQLLLSSVSSRDEARHENLGEHELPYLEMWSLDGAVAENKSKPHVSGAIVTATLFVDDGTTEAVTVRIDRDKFVSPEVTGRLLEAVVAVPSP